MRLTTALLLLAVSLVVAEVPEQLHSLLDEDAYLPYIFANGELLVTSDSGGEIDIWTLSLRKLTTLKNNPTSGYRFADAHSDGCKAPFAQGFRYVAENGNERLQPAISGSGYLAWVEENEAGSELWVSTDVLEPTRLELPWDEVWWPDWYYTFTDDDFYQLEETQDWNPYVMEPCPIPWEPKDYPAVLLFNALVDDRYALCYAVLGQGGEVAFTDVLYKPKEGDAYTPDVQAPFIANIATTELTQPLVFHGKVDGNRDIYSCDVTQTGSGTDIRLSVSSPQRLTDSSADDRFAEVFTKWNEGYFVFFASNRTGDWDIYVIQVKDGKPGEPINLTNSPDSNETHCAVFVPSEA